MNTQSETGIQSTPATICQLVKLIAANALPSALRNNSFIVNDVPAEIRIIADENLLATVLSRLLYSFVNGAESSCIRINAKEYEDIVFVQMRSTHGIDNNAIDSDLQQAQPYAKKMNGNIGLSWENEKVTGIVFSFPNYNFSKKHQSSDSHNKNEVLSG